MQYSQFLKNIAVSISGVTLRGNLLLKEYGVLPVIQPKDIQNGNNNFKPFYLTDYPASLKKHFLLMGDLLLANKGIKFATHLFEDTYPCIASASFFIIRVQKEKCYPEFLRWYLGQPVAKDYFIRNSMTSTIPSLSKSTLDKLLVPVPPLHIQKEIIEKLQVLEKQKNILKAMVQKTEEYRDAHIWEQINLNRSYDN